MNAEYDQTQNEDSHLNESDLESDGLLALVVNVGLHFDALPTDVGGALELSPQGDRATLTAETAAGPLVLTHHWLLSDTQTHTNETGPALVKCNVFSVI